MASEYHFGVEYDASHGLITVTSIGEYTVDKAAERMRLLASHSIQARRDFGMARILIITSQTHIGAAETMESAGKSMAGLLASNGGRDRIAMVFNMALARMQAQRALTSDQIKTFMCADEAKAWLLAEADANRAA